MTAAGVVSVSGLTLESLRGRNLVEIFQDATVDLPANEVVLLVGPSGSGKSLFTKLLAGLLGPWTDTIRIAPTSRMLVRLKDGREVSVLGDQYPQDLRGAVGYMFQDHALFDELTVEENIRFGNDQSRTPLTGKAWQDWLHENADRLRLGRLLPSPIGPLSGGQRQRTSLLRMLALKPEVLVFDEPTSGLDPDSASRVADLIKETQKELPEGVRPRLSLVVTHDYANLLRVADRILLLNPQRGFTSHVVSSDEDRKRLAEELPKIFASWEASRGREIDAGLASKIKNDAAWKRVRALPTTVATRVRSLQAMASSWRWHARFGWSSFRLLVLDAIPFTAVGGAAVGAVIGYFSLNSIPQIIQAQAEPIFIEELLRGLGMALFQVVAPLFAAVCLAARSGAAVAGYVSNLERSSQLDALRVLGMAPGALLGDKVVVSFALGMPILAGVSFMAATVACLLVVLLTRPLATFYTFSGSFFSALGPGAFDVPYKGTGWLLAKLVPAGILCGLLAWRNGALPKSSSEDVNRAITSTIMQGILVVLIVFFVVLLFEIKSMVGQ